jgi:transglutaminase-like putative cysteine protease
MADQLDRQQFERTAIAVAATIATHAAHLPPWLTAGLAAAIGLRLFARRRGSATISSWTRVLLTALLLVVVATRYGNVFGRLPGTALACGLLGLKLLETERTRDARVALCFSGFVLMSSLLFSQALSFSLFVGGVLVLILGALATLQPAPLPTRRPLRADLRIAATLLAASVPLGLAAFALLPRLQAPLWGSRDDGIGRTGLSETMAPGQFSQLMQDDSPAFRVEFASAKRPPNAALYFRTIVLTDFDGTTWTRRFGSDRGVPTPAARGRTFDYTVTLEATDRRWLPALDLPLFAPPGARLDDDQMLIAARPVNQPREYQLRSDVDTHAEPSIDRRERLPMLRLPSGYGPQARALAQRWREQAKDDQGVVRAALAMFRGSFTYTLSPPPLARDSVDDFLFGSRQGFCEHYASAFVFLMRAAGIPARVVTGYQGGWWSGDYLLVRQSDAHAWAEIWRDGSGWQRVDPTAAVSPARVELGAPDANNVQAWFGAEWLREVRNRFDAVNRLWTLSVVQFDAMSQRNLLSSLGISAAAQGDLLLMLSTVLGVAMLLAAAWAMRDTRARRGDALDHAWRGFRARLARAGVDDRAAEGPLDLRVRLHATAPDIARAVDPLVSEYVALRYGTAQPAASRIADLARRLRSVRLPRARRGALRRTGIQVRRVP